MKTRFTLLGIFAAIVLGICAIISSCTNDLNNVITYSGQVVYKKTTTPFPNLVVKVTNGENIHCQDFTDESGFFSLKVKVNEIDGSYYLLAGDSTCVPAKVSLGGYGQAEVDLGVIEVEGPSIPVVVTKKVSSVSADGAICGGEVTSTGRLKVTARGVCYGKDAYPEISGLHTSDGDGAGEFTSTLKDLEHNTIYYVRAYATNSLGTAYGEQVKFTTEEGVPVVITDSVYRITAHTARCKGHVESDGGYQVTKRGTCWSKHPDPTTDDDFTDEGSGLGEFTCSLKDLTEDTKYYVRTFATNNTATVYGEQIIITTLDGLPIVRTDSIVSVTATGFTAYGTVVSDCDIPVTARGFCYSTTQYPTIENAFTTVGKGLGKYQSNISDLSIATTYYVRSFATNETGTVYGEQIKVTTKDGLAVVATDSVASIAATSFMAYGTVLSDCNIPVTARGFCYATTQYPTIENTFITIGKGLGKYQGNITGLSIGTTYYVRAYATNATETVYGKQIIVTTTNGLPTVIIKQSSVTATSFSITGEIVETGGFSITERGICYSQLNANPTISDTKVTSGQGQGSYGLSVNELSPAMSYYVCAYAMNANGVSYSAPKTITTKDGAASLTLSKISDITALTASANLTITDDGGATLQSCGLCWATTPHPTIEDSSIVAVGHQLNTSYQCSMSALTPATLYYVRAYATTDVTTSYSNQVTFNTTSGLPVLSTSSTTATSSTITTGGNITSDGGYNITARGVCYSTTNSNPTVDDLYESASVASNNFSVTITNVSVSTTYYVRAYASNEIGTAYGDVKSVTTGDGLPSVITTEVGENVTATTALSGGQVTDDGGYAITARGVCWSTLPYPTINDNKTEDGEGIGYYSSSITDINSFYNTYYIRAYATNVNGTVYGEQVIITPEKAQYANLPTVVYAGYTYKIYDKIGSMTWSSGYAACQSLNFGGYSDWFMPNFEEARAILRLITISGVWTTRVYNSAQHFYFGKTSDGTWTYSHTTDTSIIGIVAVRIANQ